MKILLLGANGQVGHELLTTLRPLGEVTAATRSGRLVDEAECEIVDLADSTSLLSLLDRVTPELIVNAAAYTAVDRAENEPEQADLINHRAMAMIGDWAHANDALVVHYSTDYVFDGKASTPYHESDSTAPLGVYGRSKLAGEEALRASSARHFIFRTAWVYAARGGNFLRTMLRIGAERDELRVVNDQVGTPTPAGLIASRTADVLQRWMRLDQADQQQALGTYHLTTSEPCSWFDFATAIFAQAQAAGIIDRSPRLVPIPSSEYPTPAQRPDWSVLDNGKLALVFGLTAPPWQQGLRDVIAQLRSDPKLVTTC
ncbi:MAG: dTDP-4-dehydrorhamnose reductase [Dokdonella sp.]